LLFGQFEQDRARYGFTFEQGLDHGVEAAGLVFRKFHLELVQDQDRAGCIRAAGRRLQHPMSAIGPLRQLPQGLVEAQFAYAAAAKQNLQTVILSQALYDPVVLRDIDLACHHVHQFVQHGAGGVFTDERALRMEVQGSGSRQSAAPHVIPRADDEE